MHLVGYLKIITIMMHGNMNVKCTECGGGGCDVSSVNI